MKKPLIERFENQYIPEPNSGCWLWTGVCHYRGYGQMWAFSKLQYAHRLSWIFFRGEIPEGICVLHKCDIPCCVNPDHLFLGTHQDNMADKVCKKRQAKGISISLPRRLDALYHSKLTRKDILNIRSSIEKGKDLAIKYGVSKATISMIKNYRIWSYII